MGLFERLRLFGHGVRPNRRIPEHVLLVGIYVANSLTVAAHVLLRNRLDEASLFMKVVDVATAAQLLLPLFMLEFVPFYHYLFMIAVLFAGLVLRLAPSYPLYYYAVAVISFAVLYFVEPISMTHPVIVRISTKVTRAVRKAKIPRSIEELSFSAKMGIVHVFGFVVSLLVLLLKGYMPAVVVVVYSLVALAFFVLGIGSNPYMRIPKERYSLPLLFVLRYPLLFRLANRMKMKLHPKVEEAGLMIYELEFVSKFIALTVWYLMSLPSLALLVFGLLPFGAAVSVVVLLASLSALLYYYPYVHLNMKASSRRANVEKEYPLFLAYASALVSAGYTMYSVFKDIAKGKGNTLFKAFSHEAKVFISLVEKQGLPEVRALEKYASVHPSREYRNFLLGYIHQRRLGGNIAIYMEQKLMEALDNLRRRMERYVTNITNLAEIAIIVLVLPTLPMLVGFILAPDIVMNMLMLQVLVIIPAIGVMFYGMASAIQLEFRDEFKFSYAPSVATGVIGMVVALFLVSQKLAAGVAFVIGSIALGIYIEYLRQRKLFAEIEKTLPQLFRDLSELRQLMPIPEALSRMAKMEYPRNVKRILRRVAAMRSQGIKLTEQPWHSKSWFWKFTQFLIGKIEESGGGTPSLFRQLMLFFTEFNNIMSSVRASLKIYEFLVYAMPLMFAIVTYSTLGIFSAMGSIAGNLSGVTSQVAAAFPQFANLFRGVDKSVIEINDFIIVEMAFVLGLLTGKVVSGTIKDTRSLAIAMFVSSIVVLYAPQLVNMMFSFSPPK